VLADPGALAGGVASLVLIPLAGFLFAVTVTVIVLVRRRSARRLRAAASAPAYGGAWPPGPAPQA
jgi:hypothetical protein